MGNCFVLSVGNQDILPKNVFQINFPPHKERGKESALQTTGKSSSTYAEATRQNTPSSGKLVAAGSHGSNFHRNLPARAVSNFVTVPVTLDHGTPTVAVKTRGAKQISL